MKGGDYMAYQKQNFLDGDVLYATQLNHVEDGILANELSINDNDEYIQEID